MMTATAAQVAPTALFANTTVPGSTSATVPVIALSIDHNSAASATAARPKAPDDPAGDPSASNAAPAGDRDGGDRDAPAHVLVERAPRQARR